MTMVSSGTISIGGSATSGGLNQSINIELGRSATATSSLNESALRTLAGVPSGAISLSNFYGKSNQFAFTISTNQTNANLRTLAVNAGWDQSVKVVATLASGVTISSASTGTPALTINGSFPNGVDFIIDGVIIGRGGDGGRGGCGCLVGGGGVNGGAGGLALSVSSAVTITNNNRIAGGGGGGGGGQGAPAPSGKGQLEQSGGGGGGGIGNSTGGARCATFAGYTIGGGSAGTAGTLTTAGTGGSGGAGAGAGGAGGSYGSAGIIGNTGGNCSPRGNGGAAGGCIVGNSNITWIAFGTRNGGIS